MEYECNLVVYIIFLDTLLYSTPLRCVYIGRVFSHIDIVNLLELDGKLFNLKFLVITRNLTVSIVSVMTL